MTLTVAVPCGGTVNVAGTNVTQFEAERGNVPGAPKVFSLVDGSNHRSLTVPRIGTGTSPSLETLRSNCSTCCGVKVARISAGLSPSDCATARLGISAAAATQVRGRAKGQNVSWDHQRVSDGGAVVAGKHARAVCIRHKQPEVAGHGCEDAAVVSTVWATADFEIAENAAPLLESRSSSCDG